MKRRSGQTTVEVAVLMPLFVALIGGAIFLVYACWQGIRTQQAANLAARVQGQERVAGGTGLTEIANENGATASQNPAIGQNTKTSGLYRFDPLSALGASPTPAVSGGGLAGKINKLVRALFPGTSESEAYLQPPVIGQNVDTVYVTRVITMPRIPFLNDNTTRPQVTIQGTAYGGEDTFMYGLPRWGKTASSNNPEWQTLVGQKGGGDKE